MLDIHSSFFPLSPADSRSSLFGLSRRLLGEDLQGRRVAMQGLGHSLSRRVVSVQAFVSGAFEEELRRSADEEDARGAKRELPAQPRVHSAGARHQHIHPNAPSTQLQRKRQQFRKRPVDVRAGLTASDATTAQSTRQHTDQLADRHAAPPHQRFPSQFQRLVV